MVERYLFAPLRDALNEPSYIQMVSFLSLMFESLNTFSQSSYYTLDMIKYYSTGEFSKTNLQTYRSKHVQLLI